VLEQEPPSLNHPLFQFDNVVRTPHLQLAEFTGIPKR